MLATKRFRRLGIRFEIPAFLSEFTRFGGGFRNYRLKTNDEIAREGTGSSTCLKRVKNQKIFNGTSTAVNALLLYYYAFFLNFFL